MTSPLWSIILASRNGADTLPRCLSALVEAIRIDPSVEVLLVDNASTDATPDIMQEYCAALDAQILSESRPGKAYALNSAIESAAGDWLVFIDDDILVGPGWLEAYRRGAEHSPVASLLAGQLRPDWVGNPPEWLVAMANIGKACGCTNPEAPYGPYSALDVKGGNFAIRRSALGAVRFDEKSSNLGATKTKVTGGLDTKIALQMAPVDGGILHVPAGTGRHIISEDEMRLKWAFKRQMRIGRNFAAANPSSVVGIIKAVSKTVIFALIAPLAILFRQHLFAGRCILGLATNLGRLDRWFG
ncbi:glycosyltransferase family 2 protein [Pontixanthobacter sp. CEM42]|uniref:glycosyltransferase family 2 protein n=1 Tax=Pontixanthobacter sp. CEM42 TaxID=2792077 RepID=UPI001ADF68C3